MSSKLPQNQKKSKPKSSLVLGLILIFIAVVFIFKTYYPVAKAEVGYRLQPQKPLAPENIIPIDPEFSLLIPKIKANSPVIKNVSATDPKIYQPALSRGVAHASGSATPDKIGNVFIFAHSATNWYQASDYNAVFYLLNKLKIGDNITLYYQNKPYTYSVSQKKIVLPDEVDYMKSSSQNQLTLMTCWPPGTTLKRLIIVATP